MQNMTKNQILFAEAFFKSWGGKGGGCWDCSIFFRHLSPYQYIFRCYFNELYNLSNMVLTFLEYQNRLYKTSFSYLSFSTSSFVFFRERYYMRFAILLRNLVKIFSFFRKFLSRKFILLYQNKK